MPDAEDRGRMETIRRWIEGSPYGAALGVQVDSLDERAARLVLPYQDANSNPGKALHGGVAASLVVLGGQAVARAALGPDTAPWHTSAAQIVYLAAAVGEPITASASLLRTGKELCFVEVDVRSEAGKPVARGLSAVRGRLGAPAAARPAAPERPGGADPGPMGPHIERVPFIESLGLRIEHMAGGRSRIRMPWRERNGDSAGGVHEGALLALLDTTGAMASWAETGPGPFKASTPALQVQILAPPPRADLVGYGRVVFRDRELFLAEVELADAEEGRLVARGSVNYRIVVPGA